MTESHREEIAKLEALYASNPGGRVFVHLAEAYRKAGELERARGILSEGLARHADSASGFVVLGRVLSDLDAQEEAVEAFRRVLDLDAGNLIALRGLGDIARRGGRVREAAEHYRELLSRNPSNEEVRSLLAEAEREAEAPHWPAARAEAPGTAAAASDAYAGEPPAVHADAESPARSPLEPEPIEQPIAPHAAAPGSTGPAESAEPVFEAAEPEVNALPGDLASFAGLAPEREGEPETAAAEDDADAVSLAAADREVDLQALLDAAMEDVGMEAPSPAGPAAEPVDAEVYRVETLEAVDLPAMELRAERDLSQTAGGSAAEFEGAVDNVSEPLPVTGYEDDFMPGAGTPAEAGGEHNAGAADAAFTVAEYEDEIEGGGYSFAAPAHEDAAERGDDPLATAGGVDAAGDEEGSFATVPDVHAGGIDSLAGRTHGEPTAEYGDEAEASSVAGAYGEPGDDPSSIAADFEDAITEDATDDAIAADLPHDAGEALPARGEEDERAGAGTAETEPAESTGEFPELTLATGEGEQATDVEPPASDWAGETYGGDEQDDAPHSTFSLWLGEDADAGSLDELATELPADAAGATPDGGEPAASGWPSPGDATQEEAPFEFDLDTVELGEAVQWDAAETEGWPTFGDSEASETLEALDAAEAARPIDVGEAAGADLGEEAGSDDGIAEDSQPAWSFEEAESAPGEPKALQPVDESAGMPEPADTGAAEVGMEPAGEADDRIGAVAPGAASGGAEWGERGLETETMADLYLSQGFNDRAAEVYRALLRRRPDDERLQGKLARAESRPAAALPGADDEDESGEVWLRGVGAAWTGDAAPAEGEAAYVWTEPGLATPEPEEEGEPIGSYLQSLASWRPDRRVAAEGVTEATPAGAADTAEADLRSEPGPGTGPEISKADNEPWADAPADAADPWLVAQPDAVQDHDPWASPEEPGDVAAEGATLELTEPAAGAGAQGGQAPAAAGRSASADAAFGERYGRPEPSPEPPADAEEDDEDLAMFRSWLQSLKK